MNSAVLDPSFQRLSVTLVGNPTERESHHYTRGSIGLSEDRASIRIKLFVFWNLLFFWNIASSKSKAELRGTKGPLPEEESWEDNISWVEGAP